MSEHWQTLSTSALEERLSDVTEALHARQAANRWDPAIHPLSAEQVQIWLVLDARERAEGAAS